MNTGPRQAFFRWAQTVLREYRCHFHEVHEPLRASTLYPWKGQTNKTTRIIFPSDDVLARSRPDKPAETLQPKQPGYLRDFK